MLCIFLLIIILIETLLFVIYYYNHNTPINIKWYDATKKLPKENEKIIAIFSDIVTSGVRENDKITMNWYLGMPFYDIKELRFWCKEKEFKKVKKFFKNK